MCLPPAGAQGWALAHPGIRSAEARASDRGFLLRHNSLPGQGVRGVPGWGPLEDREWRQLACSSSPENWCTLLSSSESTKVAAAV